MFVIGVAGQAQMGKDTLADRLQEKIGENGVGWKRASFAANVKKVYCDTFGVDFAFVEKWKTNPELPDGGFTLNMRKSLQFIGDGFRTIHPNIWIDLAFREKTPKIISDVRYVNEFTRVKAEGGLNILVGRPDKLNDDPNGSEAQIRPYIEWCLNHLDGYGKFVDLCDVDWSEMRRRADAGQIACPPDKIDQFDVFVLNDGSKDDFLKLIDEKLVPFVNYNFVFEFPENHDQQENKCLISS
jgi:hypothetical protein